MKIVAFTGNSNSGKTTLIEKLSLHLKTQNKRVGIIKHDPKDKAMFDVEGKDSARFYQTGADVAILGATQSTLRFHKALSIKSLVGQFVDYDYLFVEGLKHCPFLESVLLEIPLIRDSCLIFKPLRQILIFLT